MRARRGFARFADIVAVMLASGALAASGTPASALKSVETGSVGVPMAIASPSATATTGDIDEPEPSPVVFVRTLDTSANPLKNPGGLAVDSQGNLYVVDAGNNRIQKYDRHGKFMTLWKSHDMSQTAVNSSNFSFNWGGAIAVDQQAGLVFVVDHDSSHVVKYRGDGTFLAEWQGPIGGGKQFGQVLAIALDREHALYVGSEKGIQKIDVNGKFLETLGSVGIGPGQFSEGRPAAIDRLDNLYVASQATAHVLKYDPGGKWLGEWGTGGKGDGQFNQPVGMAIDSRGRIYVADATCCIQQFDASFRYLGRWGVADPSAVLVGLAIDAEDNIYVGDFGKNAIYRFRPR